MRRDFVLRCYVEKQGNLFVAICIDLTLAAQGCTMGEARVKLEEQIKDYLVEALQGSDQEHVEDLLPRRAPFKYYVRYQYVRVMWKLLRTIYGVVNRRPAERGPANAFNEHSSKLLASI